ncbi:hypothetical protein HDU99_002907 [Rhizoclosmatium hyalinum]|nr:hypothetical protein HDU99_002907 [Rhizoclosmatium hyalinum]
MEVEDPDLMPTFQDWMIVFDYWVRKGQIRSPEYDAENLLYNYNQKSPVLRLILCCMALKITTNDDEQCALYYNRARKALLRSDLRPSLDLIIAYNCIYDHGRATSQVLISEQFLRRSIEMVIELKLDVDPDDSPWLNHLTPREKEDRRRIFWSAYDLYAWQLSVSPFPLVMNISGNGVKPPRQVYDPHPVFDEAHAYKERCEQKVVLGSIKNHYSTPPSSIYHILSSERATSLKLQLHSVQSSFQSGYILHFDNPKLITPQDEIRLIAQISNVKFHLWFYAMNMIYHIARSALYRPIMYLSALPSCSPIYLSSENQSIIIHATNQCLESAWRMSSLWVFFDYMESEKVEHVSQKKNMTFIS